ncbi:MAG: hypothetical protein IPO60_15115 [Flavobacteriales bacterium]|mgnify:FL=1|nr:hypothetical protein [Flavobacteriales bacterium]MBK6894653.1 hypothetical protein [Flavobacteriales bacterium]MBK7288628.1 hypothetical protein [Flavobacteriales bacterium]MBK9599595.1 hypothetical protein [Flavobacteriales bacterium]QQS71617.1 MAG: hypothetical protein IPP95_10520 [Flavobacteriales bacterium]
MREQHPLDDLFARTLRDAEAAPSDAVWEGIVQERGWAHLTLLRLRRRWVWLALLLLLGGTAGYVGITSSGEKHAGVPGTDSSTSVAVVPNASLGATSTMAGNASLGGSAPEIPEPSSSAAAAGPIPASSTTASQPTDDASVAEHRSPETSPDHRVSDQGHSAIKLPTSTSAVTSEADETLTAAVDQTLLSVSDGPTTGPTSGTLTAELPKSHIALATTYDRKDDSEAPGLVISRIGLLSTRSPRLDRALLQAVPQNAPTPTFIGPRQAWWLAVTVGQYRETRNWQGGDAQLVTALQGTETPHRTTNFGVLAGLEGRKGWGIATGIEYGAARYDFQHFDQFRSTRDSLVTHVITFNTQVLDSYVDTVTTYTEVRRTVAAVNRYTSLRVPLEGSWHRAWRRWHIGLRGGVAVEFNTMRSGVTLMNSDGGTRSVDVSSTEKQKATLVSGGLAVDVGYGLTERLGLWASPGYAVGLFSLSPTDGSPYAVPERLGVRIRLAYTLRPGR